MDNNYLEQLFKTYNDKYFNGAIPDYKLTIGVTPYSNRIGLCYPEQKHILVSVELINNGSDKKIIDDLLLHEMIHAHIHCNSALINRYDIPMTNKSSHNNYAWVDEMIRLSKLMDNLKKFKVEPVKKKRTSYIDSNGKKQYTNSKTFVRDGFLNRKEISSFPHTLRPNGYYKTELNYDRYEF